MHTLSSLVGRGLFAFASALSLGACVGAGTDEASEAPATLDTMDASAAEDTELPPAGATAVDRWLAKGYYRSWACEGVSHASRPPSGHSKNRICSNRILSTHDKGEYPVGAASVKELYDDANLLVGYAVATKVDRGAGDAWYWYERIGSRVIADGRGTTGPARTVCARCHARASSSTFGHDQVFTQVQP